MNNGRITEILVGLKENNIKYRDQLFLCSNLDEIFKDIQKNDKEIMAKLFSFFKNASLYIEDFNVVMKSGVDEIKNIVKDRFESLGIPREIEILKSTIRVESPIGPICSLPINKGHLLVQDEPALYVHQNLYYLVSEYPIPLILKTIGIEKMAGTFKEDGSFEFDESVIGIKKVYPKGREVYVEEAKNSPNKSLRAKVVFTEDFDGINMISSPSTLADIIFFKATNSAKQMKKALIAAGVAATLVTNPELAGASEDNIVKSINEVQASVGGDSFSLIESTTTEIEKSIAVSKDKIESLRSKGTISGMEANNLIARISAIEKNISKLKSNEAKESYKKTVESFSLIQSWASNYIKDSLKSVKGKISSEDYKDLESKMASVSETSREAQAIMKARLNKLAIF